MYSNNNNWPRLIFMCFILATQLSAFATTYTLNSSGNETLEWSNAAIWQPNGVPGADDSVIINGTGNTALITSGDISVKSMTINGLAYIFGPGILTITETLDVRYPLFWQMPVVIAEGANATMTDANFSNAYTGIYFYYDLVVNGTLVMDAQFFSGTKLIVNGTVTQKEGDLNASILVNPGGILNINSPSFPVDLGRLENKGTINWQNGLIRSLGGGIVNTGLWNISASNGLMGYGGIFQDSVFYNAGTIQIAPNVTGINIAQKMVNTGTINMAGATALSLYALDHYGSINGPAGASLTLSGYYFGTANTIYSGATVQVSSFKTATATSLAIKSGADISTITDFYFDQGPLELGVALPPAATYVFSASVQTDVDQSFTGSFLLLNGSFTGTCAIAFNTPNLTANYGYFDANVKVTFSANTILDLKALGVANLINDGTINMQPSSSFAISSPGIINNGTWNTNGNAVNIYGNYDMGAPVTCLNNGTMNFNDSLARVTLVLENQGLINIGSNNILEITGELRQFGIIQGQSGSQLNMGYTFGASTFHPGAQTSGLSVLETSNGGNVIFKQGTLLTNISKFVVNAGTLETAIVLPPTSDYWFKKGFIRLNTTFEPLTVLQIEDTNIEGSGNIRIGNGLVWHGGTMDVPVRIYESANVFIQEKEERPIISAPFTNNGRITLSGGIIEINTGFFKNSGIWNVDSDEDVIMDGFTAFTNDAVFSICGNQPIKISFNVPFINNATGIFKGQGSYTFNAGFTNTGTVGPGCSPGILTIEDDLDAPQIVEIEVIGSDPGQYDQLLVNGDMTAGEILNVVVPSGTSVNGSIKVIQTSGTFSGTFAQVNLPPNYTLQYLPDGVQLTSDGSVSATDLSAQATALSIRPTLASTSITVTAHQIIPNDAQLELYNLHGQRVLTARWSAGATEQTLNVDGLTDGLYMVKLTGLPNWKGRVLVQH